MAEFGQEIFEASVEYFSLWMEEKGKVVRNHNLALRRWGIDAGTEWLNKKGAAKNAPSKLDFEKMLKEIQNESE